MYIECVQFFYIIINVSYYGQVARTLS